MKVGREHSLPPSPCTNCGHILDAATGISEDLNDDPVPGQHRCFTLCILCGHLMMIGEDMQLRDLTDEEMIAVAGDRRLIVAQRALYSLQRDRAYVEDFVRASAKRHDQWLSHEKINELVNAALAMIPPPPRKAR